MATIAENIIEINLNYTMDMSSQLSFRVIDPGFEMAANNYFQVGRDVVYETTGIKPVFIAARSTDDTDVPIVSRIRHIYEMASVSVEQNGSASPQWTVEALPKAVMQMKRDKKPSSIGGGGYEFVQKAAFMYGLNFVGEKSSKIKSASKNAGDNQADSVWSVITSIANNSQYVVFVADGTLYFGSEKWLMYKWGSDKIVGKPKLDKKGKPLKNKKGVAQKHPDKFYVPLDYPAKNNVNLKRFEVLSMPKMRKSENDPMAGGGSLLVSRDNGVALRPGMTIRINSIPTMNIFYLITSVSFGEQVTDPVSVEFRTPERLEVNGKPAKIPQLPVGKSYRSEYFQPSPRIGETAIGLPTFSDTPPRFVAAGSTLNPVGPQTASVLPNARRPSFYPIAEITMAYLVDKNSAPNPESILETGNIDLYNRPIVLTSESNSNFCATSRPDIYTTTISAQTAYVIIERVWCNSGTPITLSVPDAIIKYNTENLHHGIFSTLADARKYVPILIKIQKNVLIKRFPQSYKSIWDGTAKPVTGCA